MALLLLLIVVIGYVVFVPTPALGELKFMLGVFVAASYVGGFIDSRLMLKADEKAKNHMKSLLENDPPPVA